MRGVRKRLPPPFHHRSYALYWAAIVTTALGGNMVVVAVGWQVYAIHRSAFDLGLIGLAEFAPLILLALPAGHISDRFPRRIVLAVSLVAASPPEPPEQAVSRSRAAAAAAATGAIREGRMAVRRGRGVLGSANRTAG